MKHSRERGKDPDTETREDHVIKATELLSILAVVSLLDAILSNFFATRYFDFPLVFSFYVGLHSPPVRGALTGSVFGIIQDAIAGLYLGINGISKALVGFFSSYLSHRLSMDAIALRFVVVTTMALVDSLLNFIVLITLSLPVSAGYWLETLLQAGVTGLAGSLIISAYDRLKFPAKDFRRLEEKSER